VARGTDPVPSAVAAAVRALGARRVRREPMAYILGEREFWGLPFKVTPAVLVPRPDSETVIEAVLALMADRARAWRILDLGVGSGCLLLTLLREYPKATGVGLDASPEALAVAADNARALGVEGRARLVAGDWRQPGWTGPLDGPFDLVVANPPYIESAALARLMPEVSSFEPRLALDGGADGLAAYRAIAVAGPALMLRDGYLVLEVGEGQALEISRELSTAGFSPLVPWKDLGGIERVLAARY
jgi:release factor glutamine methyltransferase